MLNNDTQNTKLVWGNGCSENRKSLMFREVIYIYTHVHIYIYIYIVVTATLVNTVLVSETTILLLRFDDY